MPHVDFVGPDGFKWPSATELTALIPQAWVWSWYKSSVEKNGWAGWCANKVKSEEGMTLGTQIHKEIEELIKGTSVDVCNEAQALYDHVAPAIDEWVQLEPHLISTKYRYAGTADAIVRQSYDTGLWVCDWKTSFHKSNTHPIQLALYALAWNENHSDQQIDKGFIARVDKQSDKCNVKVDEYLGLSQYYPICLALRQLWDYTEEQGPFYREKLKRGKKNATTSPKISTDGAVSNTDSTKREGTIN